MASICDDGGGLKRILIVCPDGIRRPIRLGKCSAKQAQTFRVRVEALVSACITGSMDDETSRWLAGLDDKMHARLAAVGLVTARTGGRAVLGAFIDHFIATAPARR